MKDYNIYTLNIQKKKWENIWIHFDLILTFIFKIFFFLHSLLCIWIQILFNFSFSCCFRLSLIIFWIDYIFIWMIDDNNKYILFLILLPYKIWHCLTWSLKNKLNIFYSPRLNQKKNNNNILLIYFKIC